MIEMCTFYLGGSAFVDVLYSILAVMAIKRTKKIIKILKKKPSSVKKSQAYIMRTSSEGSSSCSSEEESLEKITQNRI